MNKSLVLFAYARADLIKDSIESVINAEGSSDWKKVLIHQLEFDQVDQVVKEYEAYFDLVVRVKRQFEPALGNINFNRILGTSICFNLFQSEIVLGIEEDSMIGYDSLTFIDFIVDKYQSNRAFRGINLGSLEKRTNENLHTYSLIRFGLHGQAGVITRKTWDKFSMDKLLHDISSEGWDSRIEFHLKNGFMVTPNASRLLDRGWNGTHAPTDSSHPYYEKQKSSWVGTAPFFCQAYARKDQMHFWRIDAINYRLRDSVWFLIRANHMGASVHRFLRTIGLPRFFTDS
jgi:hypothetical protein